MSPISTISILYFLARERTASTKLMRSYSIRKSIALPPWPEPKSYHKFLSIDTLNDGLVSDLKGLRPK